MYDLKISNTYYSIESVNFVGKTKKIPKRKMPSIAEPK